MKGIVRVVTVVGLMCVSAAVFAATTLNVGPDASYQTIGAAMNDAVNGDTISVAPETYTENIKLKSGVTLMGKETARTFLQSASNLTPVITATGATGCQISRFTFINSTTGIELGSSSSVIIAANVFYLGTGGTAVKPKDSTDTTDTSTIANNTFYTNKLAVSRAGSSSTIQNNIFVSNATAIPETDSAAGITSNQFFGNGVVGQRGTGSITVDPLFVNPALHNFHVKVDSAGRGAYTGIYADPIPFPVQNVEISDSTVPAPNFSVTVTWAKDVSYLTDSYFSTLWYYFEGKPGAKQYNGTEANFGPSPHNVEAATQVTMVGAAPTFGDAIDAPVLNPIEPQSQALKLSWTRVTNATSYEVHYGVMKEDGSVVEEQPKDVGNADSYVLSGLQNKVTYLVGVVALRQPILHVAITSQDKTTGLNSSSNSKEATKALGVATNSGTPKFVKGIPEDIVAYPALPNEGCFIATAAYGSYSAAQVKTLRDFRDNYLLTNTPGRAFVRWYYANSPPAAHYLNQHPALKPVVRGLLLPFVFITSWMNSSTFEVQLIAIALTLGLMSFGFYWRRRTLWA